MSCSQGWSIGLSASTNSTGGAGGPPVLLASPLIRWFPHYHPRVPVAVLGSLIPSPSDVRVWSIVREPQNLVLTTPLPQAGKLRVSLHRILMEAGIALTQATSAWSPEAMFALFRYAATFRGTGPDLRIAASPWKKPSHVTRAQSEEIATGITTYVMREHLGAIHITDVGPLVSQRFLQHSGIHGKKEPDFIGICVSGNAILVESKGRTGSITSAINDGKQQVANIQSNHFTFDKNGSGYVVGTEFLRQGLALNRDTETIVDDPVVSNNAAADARGLDVAVRHSYAKAFRFVMQDLAAEYILNAWQFSIEDGVLNEFFDNPFPGDEVVPIGYSPFGDIVGLHRKVLAVLASGTPNVHAEVSQAIQEPGGQLEIVANTGYALSNGIVIKFGLGEA